MRHCRPANVGKSALFNALTKAGIAAENYPFYDEPNVGIVPELPDPRLAKLAEIIKPERVVPAIVEFVDIAGLVAGASKARGWATSFWPHPRDRRHCERGALLRRPQRDSRGGTVDPVPDIEVVRPSSALPTWAPWTRPCKALYQGGKSGNDKEAAESTYRCSRGCRRPSMKDSPRGAVFSDEERRCSSRCA